MDTQTFRQAELKKWKGRTEKIGRKSRENEKDELSYSANFSVSATEKMGGEMRRNGTAQL